MSSICPAVIVAERSPLVVWTLTDSGSDRYHFRQPADLERDGTERQTLGGAQHDALLLVGLEALDGDGQVERSSQEVRDR